MTITMLYKGKREQNDLDNWRGICRKKMTAKVVSSIMATRLLTIIDTYNVAEQFTTLS
jgi:hypothetical protein